MRDPSEDWDIRWVDSRGGVHFVGRRHDYTNGFRMAAIMRNLREPEVWADLVGRIKEFLVLFLLLRLFLLLLPPSPSNCTFTE